VALFLIPSLWGLVSLSSALAPSAEVVCPGENVGEDGEERPGPMRPGDAHCAVLEGSAAVGSRSYDEQARVQSLERREDAGQGVLLLAYGAAGALLTWRATRRPGPDDA
jgi:hypothetical protein